MNKINWLRTLRTPARNPKPGETTRCRNLKLISSYKHQQCFNSVVIEFSSLIGPFWCLWPDLIIVLQCSVTKYPADDFFNLNANKKRVWCYSTQWYSSLRGSNQPSFEHFIVIYNYVKCSFRLYVNYRRDASLRGYMVSQTGSCTLFLLRLSSLCTNRRNVLLVNLCIVLLNYLNLFLFLFFLNQKQR